MAPQRVRTLLLLLGAACAASPRASSDSIIGTWQGRAVFRAAPLEFAVRFFADGDSLRATFSSPDLLLLDQPLDSIRHEGSRISFSTRDDYPLHFRGVRAGDVIRGTADVPAVPGVIESRRGADTTPLRFELTRLLAPSVPPYVTRAIRFDNADTRLAGTLLLPSVPTNARRPGIVILQGSTTNLRREYSFYADHFARAGLAVVSFDKRGTGESSGNYAAATYDDLAADAAAAVQFLREQPGIDSARIGVWGLSQGAFIAPLVARRVPLAFVVAISPPGVTIGESAAYQDSVRLIGKGFSTPDAGSAAQLNRQVVSWLRTGAYRDELEAALARVVNQPWRRASSLPARLPASPGLEGWYWRGRTLDPIPLWQSLRAPVLVVFGEADELLPAPVSATRIRSAFRAGGNRDATVRVFPAANHVLRQLPLVAGGKWDWPKAAPGYLNGVTAWIVAHTR